MALESLPVNWVYSNGDVHLLIPSSLYGNGVIPCNERMAYSRSEIYTNLNSALSETGVGVCNACGKILEETFRKLKKQYRERGK